MITVALIVWTSQRFPGEHGGLANWIAAFVLCVFPLVDAFAPLPSAAQETNIYKDSIDRFNALPEKRNKTDSISYKCTVQFRSESG